MKQNDDAGSKREDQQQKGKTRTSLQQQMDDLELEERVNYALLFAKVGRGDSARANQIVDEVIARHKREVAQRRQKHAATSEIKMTPSLRALDENADEDDYDEQGIDVEDSDNADDNDQKPAPPPRPQPQADPRASDTYQRMVAWGERPEETARLHNEMATYVYEWVATEGGK